MRPEGREEEPVPRTNGLPQLLLGGELRPGAGLGPGGGARPAWVGPGAWAGPGPWGGAWGGAWAVWAWLHLPVRDLGARLGLCGRGLGRGRGLRCGGGACCWAGSEGAGLDPRGGSPSVT